MKPTSKDIKFSPDAHLTVLQNKPIKKALRLHSFSDLDGLIFTGTGSAEVSAEQLFQGEKTIKVTTPSLVTQQTRDTGFCGRLILPVGKEDWSVYNRIAFDVYPAMKHFENGWISIELDNGGETRTGDCWAPIKHLHFINVLANQWNRVTWEIADIPRDCMEKLQLNFEVRGKQPGTDNETYMYLHALDLEEVEPDKFAGWNCGETIAFCHSGYAPGDAKIAVTQITGANQFSIENCFGTAVYTGKATNIENENGSFSRLDFSDFNQCGQFKIRMGDFLSKPFEISSNHWLPAAEKGLKFFRSERCGCTVEGSHWACHRDCFTVHPDGRKLCVAGGWHDAGDLSQGLCNTSETVHTFLDLYSALKDTQPEIAEQMLDEARYGLEWMLNTRFGDGFRAIWFGANKWTDGIIGTFDDILDHAENEPFENLCAAAAEARAAEIFSETQPQFSAYCLQCAKEDFGFALENLDSVFGNEFGMAEVQLCAEAAVAAMQIHRVTNEKTYPELAVKYGDRVMACQQLEPTDWEIPLSGFFYEDRQKAYPLHYDHRSHEQAPVMALAMLLERLPEHEKSGLWKNALELYRDYVLKISEYGEPFGLIPEGIYLRDYPSRITVGGNHIKELMDEETYLRSIQSGVRIGEGVYIRRLPAFKKFRGGFAITLTKAKAASVVGKALNDPRLLQLANRQLGWAIGCNPFARSYMYGEGYDYPEMYTGFSLDMVGEIPVGMNSFKEFDIPYMPQTTAATSMEVWVHSVSRFLWTLSDIL